MGSFMKGKGKILEFPKLQLIDQNDPYQIIEHYLLKLEEALSSFDHEDHRIEQAFIHLQEVILWWDFYLQEE